MKISYKQNPLETLVELDEEEIKTLRKKIKDDEWTENEAEERLDDILRESLKALKSSHDGDCVCSPCTCFKCLAEDLLGIDTLEPFPGKHQLNHIFSVFLGENITIDQALEKLKNYEPHATWSGWEAHAERWKREASEAYEYLIKYRKKHFG